MVRNDAMENIKENEVEWAAISRLLYLWLLGIAVVPNLKFIGCHRFLH